MILHLSRCYSHRKEREITSAAPNCATTLDGCRKVARTYFCFFDNHIVKKGNIRPQSHPQSHPGGSKVASLRSHPPGVAPGGGSRVGSEGGVAPWVAPSLQPPRGGGSRGGSADGYSLPVFFVPKIMGSIY